MSDKTTSAELQFTGKDNGITFDKFDEMVISWGRLKYGEKYAQALWRNELIDLNALDLTVDLDKYKFEEHCSFVNDVISCDSPKYASYLLKDKRFETVKWQLDCRYRFREKMFCHLETLCNEEALRQLQKRGVSTMATMREFFFRRFAVGQPEKVKKREDFYLAGMPNANGEVFPPRCNMDDKLNALEKEREYLLQMCPKDKRDEYENGKETKLVRIILEKLPKEYDEAVKTCRNILRFRKASESGALDLITNLEDNVRMNYSTDWLPPYVELRTELLNEYYLHERRRAEEGRKQKGGHPVLPILQGHDQPGPEQRACYGCGQKGDHFRGDPKCPAGPNAIWDGAPEIWKERIRKRGKGPGKGAGKGKGKGKPSQRNLGRRGLTQDSPAKTPCPNWSRGNGFCKYGPNCRYSHDGPKAGNKRKNEVVFLTTKKGKKARKQLSSLLMKDIQELSQKGGTKEKGPDDDDHLYQLIRGSPSVIISRGGNEVDYKPLKPKYKTNVVEDDSENDSEDDGSVFPRLNEEDKERIRNLCSATDKWEAAIAVQPEAALPNNRFHPFYKTHAWKGDKGVAFTCTLMITAGLPASAPEGSTGEESTGEEDDNSEAESLVDEANVPCPRWSRGDGSCQFGDSCKYSHDGPKGGEGGSQSGDSTESKRPLGQSNRNWRENVNLGQSNRNFQNLSGDKTNDEELVLQDEKISHLKEQMTIWKIRACSAEERVTRLLQLQERQIKESHDVKRKNDEVVHESRSARDDLPPELTHFRRAGRRARLSDTLSLMTDPKWASDPDPDAEWIVLKIPKGNDSYFLADFVDGDKEDNKEWLEGPFQQRWSVDYLVGLKRMDRHERRQRSNYLRAYEGKSMGRKKSTQRKDSGSVESMARSIAPNTTQWPDLSVDPVERYEAAVRRNYPDPESSPEPDNEHQAQWVLNSGKRVSVEEVFTGERRRLERAAKDLEDESRIQSMLSPVHRKDSETVKESPGARPKPPPKKRRRSEDEPIFFIGDEVGFCDNRARVSGAGRITKIIRPGEKGNPYHSHLGLFDPDAETLYEVDTIGTTNPGRKGWIRESMMWKTKGSTKKAVTSLPVSQTKVLHPMNHVGVDTCSAVSVSTEIADFIYLDRSEEARNSLSLNGVGQGGPEVMGRGPMIVCTLDSKGNKTFMWDPAGVLIKGGENQARMRILGQQRMKRFGFHVVQEYSTSKDHLIYRDKINIPLTENNGILMIQTQPWMITDEQLDWLEQLVTKAIDDLSNEYCYQIRKGDSGSGFGAHREIDPSPVLMINEAKLTKEERERLDHWRHAHRSSSGERFKERCHTCEQAKHKATYKRNDFYKGTTTSSNQPYFRLYADGYGGQNSMGSESYEGGVGGFVFACPVSGKIKTKLYSTQEEFPAALYQVLQEIETEGYVCRELYVDTHAVNISAGAEEVASMFKMRIIPISGGTPQELAYAESAVRTLGQMSRAQMIGAPHLPQMMWGLSDLHAAYVHSSLPQKGKQGKSPHEMTTGRKPDDDMLFIHVFGCPCQYAPANAPDHKRAPKTEWGWYVGIQWPMVLILRPFDNKVISISRKKVHCHEMMYAKFDAEYQTRPRIEFKDFTLDKDEVDCAIKKAAEREIPDHVLSIKVLSDFKRNKDLNVSQEMPIPQNLQAKFNAPQHDPGEECDIPYVFKWNKDRMLEEIEKFKKKLGEENLTARIIKALKIMEDETTNQAPGRNSLRKKKNRDEGVAQATLGKRIRTARVSMTQSVSSKNKRKKRLLRLNIAVPVLESGDRVKIKTFRFGKAYAKGRPVFTYGNIVSTKGGKVIDVRWDNDEGDGEVMKTKLSDLQRVTPVLKIVSHILKDVKECGWPIRKVEAMFPVLEVGSQLTESDLNANGNWPRDFIEALIRPDWRLWVEAVKSENESWDVFEATIEIPYKDIKKGASVIPLGELFTIKRSGKYKFRQIALGNLLKEGKDYGETFATTVSGDGLRWFCSLAVTCGKEIKGWDATTGYLQTEQRVPVYAYLPSHHGFSNLEYEDLAKFRTQLLEVLKSDGIKGIKEFSRKIRQERRVRPESVLELKRSVYGIPDAGQSFSMFMQSLHIKKCQMVQSDMDPCLFYKIFENEKDEHGNGGEVTSYLIVITWVDDCRYFGTEDLVKEYEKVIGENCKCTFEGKSSEFVSIKIDHDIDNGTLELTQPDYWEKAVIRFKQFLPLNGPKERAVPLSPTDERLLVEPTEEEIKAGEHLPYPNVLGVVQYPSNFTKMEMRYAMSVLSRHRTKWGVTHFKILLKSLEYGWSTRAMGVKYNANLDVKYRNILIAYADSSFSTPRSQGCRIVMMNGGAISFTSKKHTTTDDSTTAAELTEAYLCACDVEGFRNMNEEIGLRQEGPTVLYQDNQSAIQIAMNRGSLSKKTRAMEVRTLTLRNKVEDMKVVPIWVETDKMLADLGTKALDPKPFVSMRDRICGYVKSWF